MALNYMTETTSTHRIPGIVYVIHRTTTPTDSTDELFWAEEMTRKELAIEMIKAQPFFGGKHAT